MGAWRRWRRGRSGRFPAGFRAGLVDEGLPLLEEGLPGSLTYRHYRAPGVRTSWSRESTAGSIAVTRRRVVVWLREGKHIDLPHGHELRPGLEVTLDAPDRIRFAYTAETFRTDRSGEVELRLRTPRAARAVELLTERVP